MRPKHLGAGARAALLAYAWPGNVRELANLMERVTVLTDDLEVTAAALVLPDATSATEPATLSAASPASLDGDGMDGALSASVRRFEREQILAALRRAHGNVSRAARALKIPRNTLRHRMTRLGLSHPRALGH